jgi:hypothetical protein
MSSTIVLGRGSTGGVRDAQADCAALRRGGEGILAYRRGAPDDFLKVITLKLCWMPRHGRGVVMIRQLVGVYIYTPMNLLSKY